MELFHNSQDKFYRSPSGAVKAGEQICIRLSVKAESAPDNVQMRIFDDVLGETTIAMDLFQKGDNSFIYEASIKTSGEPRLIWYDFAVYYQNATYFYINNPESLGGVGQTVNQPTANSYQITVYSPEFKTPDLFKGRIMYQIFPDRFFGWHNGGEIPKKRDEYIIHKNWYEPISFNPHPFENGPACNDFYGGNLKGIEKKLPYLKSLGVGVIYINPIFDAYSNHKYDTADYKTIDPMFGTEEDFKSLCKKAEELDIKIILDGVFSHTGADSIYFNKYKSYGDGVGAYQDYHSPYHSWYQFNNFPDYESWWGCSNLPNVNEMDETYLDYILRDDDAVIKKWLRLGSSGWRLDVADELPDEFIQILRKEAKKQNPDAVIIGEVWEDASNKTAYGKLRKYLLGSELDSVMNYPFKDGIIGFIMGNLSAEELNRRVMSQIENYPIEVLYSLMNIIGTHDTMRIKSLFGGMDENCKDTPLTSYMEDLAVKRVMLAVFMQMTFYGVPCIYYGDEAGMEGGKDPYNRQTFPWRKVDPELFEYYKKLGEMRNNNQCLKSGYFETVYAKDNVYAYVRYFIDNKDVFGNKGNTDLILCVINRGFESFDIEIDLSKFGIPKIKQIKADALSAQIYQDI